MKARRNIELPPAGHRLPRRAALGAAATIALLASAVAGAGTVHVRVGTEVGAGYTVGRGDQCFVVTPFHVVRFAPADGVAVTDSAGGNAMARLVKGSEEFDAGLLQVVSGKLDCPADWSDGASAATAIGAAPFLVARKIDDNGRVMQTRLFAASTSREQLELEPFSRNDELREGDSGSAVFAGEQLVAMIVSVDTKSGQATALTQSQIHGLFGADVLPGAQRMVALGPFTYRRADNAYASVAARERLAGSGFDVRGLPADGKAPEGAAAIIKGQIVDLASTRAANPDYVRPEAAKDDDESVGRQLLNRIGRRVEAEVDSALERDRNAPYLRTFNIDVQVDIQRVGSGENIVNLERHSIVVPEPTGTAVADLEKTAIERAVREAIDATLKKYPL